VTMKHGIRAISVWLILLTVQADAAECLAIEGPSVRVSTLTPFIQQTASLQADRIVASTPDPGLRRWITAAEMRRLDLSPRVGLPEIGACIERQLHTLQSEDVRREVQAALAQARSNVQNVGITSIQPLLVPQGRLSLPPTQVQLLSSANGFCSFLWRGTFEFDSHRLLTVKILGRYQAETSHFVAKRGLEQGDVLGASDYERVVEPGCSPTRSEVAPLEGSIVRRALSKGGRIEAAVLREPTAVEQGAEVWVVASVGGASVRVEAVAETPGCRGERVFVRNNKSGKRIQVLLTGRGEASAIAAGATR